MLEIADSALREVLSLMQSDFCMGVPPRTPLL
jgi:hypothetical protein